jgi:hypothetical protein
MNSIVRVIEAVNEIRENRSIRATDSPFSQDDKSAVVITLTTLTVSPH